MVHDDACALVLDGGRATRLGGTHKAFLEVDGEPIAARTARVLRRIVPSILVATSRPDAWAALEVRTVRDPVANAGPLAGIAAGLAAAEQPLVLVLAGDMPAVSEPVARALLDVARSHPGSAVVPLRDGRPEVLHAVYPASAADVALDCLSRGVRRITDFLKELTVVELDAAELPEGERSSFTNVNAPEDLATAGVSRPRGEAGRS